MSNRTGTAVGSAQDLCDAFVRALPISGASVTVMVPSGARLTLCSTDVVAARLDELQFELGEGPQWSVASSGTLVMIPDVAADAHEHWPVLGAALKELPVGGLFGVPIRMGAVTLGVATLHSATPMALTADQQNTAMAVGSAIAGPAAHFALQSADDDSPVAESVIMPALRREVHQATGILLVLLNTSATDAYSRLQAYAFAHGRTVQAVAHDVVAGDRLLDQPTTDGTQEEGDDDNRYS